MSRPPSRGRLKANAVVLVRLIHSPSARKDNSVLPAMNVCPKCIIAFTILALPALAPAEIDSGGGKSSGGALFSHSSIGESFATPATQAVSYSNHPGLIEVLYPITPSSITDVNGNGLPDGWEIQYFGSLGVDPGADADHDGTNNLMEYLAGTHPIQSSSVFRPKGIYVDRIFQMPIQTVFGRNYQIWVSRNLIQWTLHRTLTGDDSEQLYEFDETLIESGPLYSATHPSSYFFRVQILMAPSLAAMPDRSSNLLKKRSNPDRNTAPPIRRPATSMSKSSSIDSPTR